MELFRVDSTLDRVVAFIPALATCEILCSDLTWEVSAILLLTKVHTATENKLKEAIKFFQDPTKRFSA